ncbi:hypothetical protein SBDP1_200011 [Syntrophobacter sp. SbD1]|nr:hypothetical protein SBDP1_200011 [Syntrophobacter sp. SbD1]
MSKIHEMIASEGSADPSVSKCRIQDVFAVVRAVHPAFNGLLHWIIRLTFLQDILSTQGPLVCTHSC